MAHMFSVRAEGFEDFNCTYNVHDEHFPLTCQAYAKSVRFVKHKQVCCGNIDYILANPGLISSTPFFSRWPVRRSGPLEP